MRITKKYLERLIKEEVSKIIGEEDGQRKPQGLIDLIGLPDPEDGSNPVGAEYGPEEGSPVQQLSDQSSTAEIVAAIKYIASKMR